MIDNLNSGPDYTLPKETIEFLKNQIEDLKSNTINIDHSEYKHIFDDPNKIKKQTDAKYEIYINIVANVLENIEDAEFPESKSIVTNNYFIPVPSGQDHNVYLSEFFKYMQECMSISAQKADKDNNNVK
jgi:hypothetical protein